MPDEGFELGAPDDWSFTLLLVSVARNRLILVQETVEPSGR